MTATKKVKKGRYVWTQLLLYIYNTCPLVSWQLRSDFIHDMLLYTSKLLCRTIISRNRINNFPGYEAIYDARWSSKK